MEKPTPFDLAEAYSAGEISRSDLVARLGSYPYVPREHIAAPLDDPMTSVPGTFEEVNDALGSDLIDHDLYSEIADAIREHNGGCLP
jgi:hypothetical protein